MISFIDLCEKDFKSVFLLTCCVNEFTQRALNCMRGTI